MKRFVSAFLLSVFTFLFMLNVNAKELYNKSSEFTVENGETETVYPVKMDNEIEKDYLRWTGFSNTQYFKIIIDDLSIDLSQYADVRLKFDSLTTNKISVDFSITRTYSLIVYIYNISNEKYGPYYIEDFEFTGFFESVDAKKYHRSYDLLTENIKKAGLNDIKKIEILPYGNFALVGNNTSRGDIRSQKRAAEFIMASVEVDGYKEKLESEYETSKLSQNEVDGLRLKSAFRIYDIATIKWSPSVQIAGQKFSSATTTTYEPTEVYYGPTYNEKNKVPVEKFASKIDSNGILSIPEDNTLFVGSTCSPSVYYSISKFLPFKSYLMLHDMIWNRNVTTLLGDLDIDGEDSLSVSVYNKLYQQYLNYGEDRGISTTNYANNNQKLISNTTRMSYSSATPVSTSLSYYPQIGYYSSSTYTQGGPLVLTLNNLSIEFNNNAKIKLRYLKYKNDSAVSSSEFKVLVTLSDESQIELSDDNVLITHLDSIKIQHYDIYDIEVSITNNQGTISKIEIMPYGDTVKSGSSDKFRLNLLSVYLGNSVVYTTSASLMNLYYDLNNNVDESYVINLDTINKINSQSYSSNELREITAKDLASQRMFNGYSELIVGDVVAMHGGNGGHIRLITGSTHVVCNDGTILTNKTSSGEIIPKKQGNCNSHGGINGNESYIIETDIAGGYVYHIYGNNSYGGLINSDDFVASTKWIPNSSYTDITADDISGKNDTIETKQLNLNYYMNRKLYFTDLLEEKYLPITFNDYIDREVEEPYATIINENTLENISVGLKGSIYSNYSIQKVSFELINFDKDESTKISVYPDESYDTTNRQFNDSNVYSLYYNLPNDDSTVNEKIIDLVKNTTEYEIVIRVDVGTTTKTVLKLSTKKEKNTEVVDSPNTGIKKYSFIGIFIILTGVVFIMIRKKGFFSKSE